MRIGEARRSVCTLTPIDTLSTHCTQLSLYSTPRGLPHTTGAMFSKSLARAANRSCASAAAGTSSSTTSAVCFTARRQHHQRRHSSSKTSSCPTGRKAAAEEKAGIAEATTTTQSQQQRGAKRVTRPKRSRSTAVPDKQEDQFAGLPAVPGMHMSNSGMSCITSRSVVGC